MVALSFFAVMIACALVAGTTGSVSTGLTGRMIEYEWYSA